ncbi:MAG: glyoxalase [Microbacteriaceae bacterium]|jgi:catechol 2,3-dioxygenase-like lactoylglutathione lyase family enzyme|nr:glyoxalase [Microbacteriaceae bacterium]HEV7955627.1 VOC family protein [Marisediminicola sp.]
MLRELNPMAVLAARDLQRARAFYRDTLGLDPSDIVMGQLMYSAPSGMRFMIYETENAGTAQNTQMCWMTADFDAEIEQLRSRGVKFEDYDQPGLKTENGVATMDDEKSAWFKDSEGNILCIAQVTAAFMSDAGTPAGAASV